MLIIWNTYTFINIIIWTFLIVNNWLVFAQYIETKAARRSIGIEHRTRKYVSTVSCIIFIKLFKQQEHYKIITIELKPL